MNTKTDGVSRGLVASIYLAFSEDGENIRFWTSNAFRAVEWAQENWETEAFVRLSDAEAKLSECVTSYEKEVAGLASALDAKDAEIERLLKDRGIEHDLANRFCFENNDLRSKVAKQSAALKLAKCGIVELCEAIADGNGLRKLLAYNRGSEAVAAIDALKGE